MNCPKCKSPWSADPLLSDGGHSTLTPGDVCVCSYCAEASLFTEYYDLAALSSAQVAALPKEMKEKLARARLMIYNLAAKPKAEA